METRKLYFAYGMNTNLTQMEMRCSKAELVGAWTLPDWRLTFRGVADIEYSWKKEVHGVMWRITKDCEKSLDILEGYPNLYRKEYVPVTIGNIHNGGSVELLMFYKMNRGDVSSPSEYYYQCIREGYEQNGIDTKHLDTVVDDIRAGENMNEQLRLLK